MPEVITATRARQNLYGVIHDVVASRRPVCITSRSGNAVLISEDDYRSMEETFYLCSIPGMREKIIEGLNTPWEDCEELRRDE